VVSLMLMATLCRRPWQEGPGSESRYTSSSDTVREIKYQILHLMNFTPLAQSAISPQCGRRAIETTLPAFGSQ
jgi:hypothetical protein